MERGSRPEVIARIYTDSLGMDGSRVSQSTLEDRSDPWVSPLGMLARLSVPYDDHAGDIAHNLFEDNSKIAGPESGDSISEPHEALPAALPSLSKVFGGSLVLGTEDNDRDRQCYLPPKEEGHSLLRDYLRDFNSKIPLFHPDNLYTLFYDCYSGAAVGVPLTWVIIYAVLGISHRLRAVTVLAVANDISESHWYMERCLEVLPKQLLDNPSLSLVQALLGVSILLQTSKRMRRAAVLTATAMHFAQDLGYHDAKTYQHAGNSTLLEQQYSFWIAFFMDAHFSFAAMRPSKHRRDQISIPVPELQQVDWWYAGNAVSSTSQRSINVFALHCQLAAIEAQALEKIFLVQQIGRSSESAKRTLVKLTTQLDRWQSSNGMHQMSVEDMRASVYQSDVTHGIMLEAAYFRVRHTLHATSLQNFLGNPLKVFNIDTLKLLTTSANSLCYSDAKRFLSLAALIPQDNLSITW